ncbi:Asp-tRNA(Asn)/Glu-tRNA(Gln) amidotransferase GatCAB subunit C [candidate division WWE3 bacterium CG10_big_fil_rev_8_21_14_0_10_32_10]|uniref:Asp-tRNA(Asn)/Glu-tRNA(Gln) amidotransferase GatCAB subunit C n=1 Tax=candidate division WWE3 bacterium CG10_big_fil_rev_8_21_14_0_10_32_10 TaxID=1975090 RepID=A0A2H0R9Z5_UNCKA|nr:MAG: Asp-tRNA(Asn)/Glu-tRNA(Gln) amidotransferase GatCAB subunit C [candidate division WWE3 bacterium CG10_big_fil_rev_8_21_14_0_10_32_10]
MDKEIIRKTEKLAKLDLREERFEKISRNLQDILEYIKLLEKLDASSYSSIYNASGLKNISVADEPDLNNVLSQKQAVLNAVKESNGYIVVPRVIKG